MEENHLAYYLHNKLKLKVNANQSKGESSVISVDHHLKGISRHSRFLTLALATTLLGFPMGAAYAIDAETLPSGEKIVFGDASFDRDTPNVLTIKQGSDRLFIDWYEGFNVGEKAAVRFDQPNSESIVVNRVTSRSKNPTQILGEISANGKVIVLDNNGIIFGKSSRIDVGGLVASTGDIDVEHFVSGEKTLRIENALQGEIINTGTITVADAGLTAFVAPNVRNDGLIVARKGTIVMGAAQMATLDLYGDGLIEVKVAEEHLKDTDIKNDGKIDNEGGRVLVTAAYVDDVVSQLVNMTEITKGETFRVRDGKIIIGDTKGDPVPEPAPAPAPAPAPVPTPVPVPDLTPDPIPDTHSEVLKGGDSIKDRNYSFIIRSQYPNWMDPSRMQDKALNDVFYSLAHEVNPSNEENSH